MYIEIYVMCLVAVFCWIAQCLNDFCEKLEVLFCTKAAEDRSEVIVMFNHENNFRQQVRLDVSV